eukprot:scaffold2893_cov254-Pinguiococcus_pyrenoidosus.AAC.18
MPAIRRFDPPGAADLQAGRRSQTLAGHVLTRLALNGASGSLQQSAIPTPGFSAALPPAEDSLDVQHRSGDAEPLEVLLDRACAISRQVSPGACARDTGASALCMLESFAECTRRSCAVAAPPGAWCARFGSFGIDASSSPACLLQRLPAEAAFGAPPRPASTSASQASIQRARGTTAGLRWLPAGVSLHTAHAAEQTNGRQERDETGAGASQLRPGAEGLAGAVDIGRAAFRARGWPDACTAPRPSAGQAVKRSEQSSGTPYLAGASASPRDLVRRAP